MFASTCFRLGCSLRAQHCQQIRPSLSIEWKVQVLPTPGNFFASTRLECTLWLIYFVGVITNIWGLWLRNHYLGAQWVRRLVGSIVDCRYIYLFHRGNSKIKFILQKWTERVSEINKLSCQTQFNYAFHTASLDYIIRTDSMNGCIRCVHH